MDEFAKQKALEIAQAVFRVCALVKREKLRIELENAAVDLTARVFAPDASKGEYLAYIEIIRGLERLTALAETAGEIKPINARVLFRECGNLVSACGDIVARRAATDGEDVDLEEFFAQTEKNGKFGNEKLSENPAMGQSGNNGANGWLMPSESRFNGKSAGLVDEEIRQSGNSIDLPDRRVIRQTEENGNIVGLVKKTLILNKVRDSGGCRIKDLTAAFPEVNERTLRYNLQKLCEAGALVKIGGGPAVRYLAKNES